MKFCNSCKHCDMTNFYGLSCKESARVDVVRGGNIYQSAAARRHSLWDSCGPEGKLWEKKSSVWDRLKGIFK